MLYELFCDKIKKILKRLPEVEKYHANLYFKRE